MNKCQKKSLTNNCKWWTFKAVFFFNKCLFFYFLNLFCLFSFFNLLIHFSWASWSECYFLISNKNTRLNFSCIKKVVYLLLDSTPSNKHWPNRGYMFRFSNVRSSSCKGFCFFSPSVTVECYLTLLYVYMYFRCLLGFTFLFMLVKVVYLLLLTFFEAQFCTWWHWGYFLDQPLRLLGLLVFWGDTENLVWYLLG